MKNKAQEISEATYRRMAISDLVPAEYNPRKISDEALGGLTESITQLGMVQPIVWNKSTGRVVGGHQRLKVLQAQGVTRTTVAVVELDEHEEKALNVALNNPHTSGAFSDGLDDVLREIMDVDTELFTDLQLDKLLVESPITPEREPSDDLDIPRRVQPGDIWELGDHYLLCGSSGDAENVARLTEGVKCQAMWTDPPYGVDYSAKQKRFNDQLGGDRNEGAISSDTPEKLEALYRDVFSLAATVVDDAGAVYVAYSVRIGGLILPRVMEESGFEFRQQIIWVKACMVLSRLDYHSRHETLWYGHRKGKKKFGRNLGSIQGRTGWFGDDAQTDVFEFPTPCGNKLHPTMKPVELIQAMLINSTRPGDYVYEPFAGSGSTLIACELMNRYCLAIELSPEYCDAILWRWEELTQGKARKYA